ncbi:MAG: mobilization protein [Bradyrhizobiaceae bacterium]|nr:mobilization protein [Bradyrhizobiaceae bacterium]
MALSDPINLRLSIDRKRQYEDDAARRGMPLTTYLRRRLEDGDQVSEQLAELRRLILDAQSGPTSHEDSPAGEAAPDPSGVPSTAMLVEVLLLLRSVVDADKLRMVHGELRRQGLPVWTGATGERT